MSWKGQMRWRVVDTYIGYRQLLHAIRVCFLVLLVAHQGAAIAHARCASYISGMVRACCRNSERLHGKARDDAFISLINN